MTIWISSDSGASWRHVMQVDVDPLTGAAYSAMLALNETHALLVYERAPHEQTDKTRVADAATVTLRTIDFSSLRFLRVHR